MNLDKNKVESLNRKFYASSPVEIIRESKSLFGNKIIYECLLSLMNQL